MSEWNEGTGTGPEILKNGKRMTATEIFNGLMENEQLEARCAKFGDALILASKNLARRGKQRDEYKARCAELEGAHKAERQDRLRLQDRFIELESEKAELEAKVEDLEAELVFENNTIKMQKKLVQQLEAEKAQQQERIAELQAQEKKWIARNQNFLREILLMIEGGQSGQAGVFIRSFLESTEPTPHPAERGET